MKKPPNPQRIGEGWRIPEREKGGVKIKRSFASSPFATDEEALAFVQAEAAEGSQYHIDCLTYVMMKRMTA